MELCTTQAISNLPKNNNHHHRSLATVFSNTGRARTSFSVRQTTVSRSGYGLRSRILYYTNPLPRATTSGETSSGANQYYSEKSEGVIVVEEVPPVEKNVYNESVPTEVPEEEPPADGLTFELLEKVNIKFDSEDTYSILLYGSGALVAVWLASGIVGAVDSIPLFPKLMEVVGLGYTLWFSTRYLLFKKDREELVAKVEELKQQVLGSDGD